VECGDVLERILRALALAPRYRYQKFRTIFDLDGLQLCLDETPLGCFIELEGAPEAIDRLAGRWGFEPDQYVIETYRDLHERQARERGQPRGDLLMDADGGAPS
jgi:adenylate cyclase class 2